MGSDLSDRGQKSVEVASTYIQVLIGLASGIIAAILGLSTELISTLGFSNYILKVSLIFFGVSISLGLLGLGGLVHAISYYKKEGKQPPSYILVRLPVMGQFVFFGVGIFVLIYVIP